MHKKPTYDELAAKVEDLERKLADTGSLQENLYRNIIQHMQHEVHIWELIRDEDGAIKTWKLFDANPQALGAWKKDLQDVVGKTTEEIFPGANATELFLPLINKIMSENKPHAWENYFPGTDQTLYMISIPFGELFISTGIDISDVKNTQKELEDTYLRLKEVIQAANIGLWDWDLKTNKVMFSKEWKNQLGYNENELENDYSEWQSRIHPDDLERALNNVKQSIESKVDTYSSEFRIRHKDGSYKWILTHGSVIQNDLKEPTRMLGSHIDITERKKMEHRLIEAKKVAEDANKTKSQLLANISHEMRTPLNAIIGFSDIIMNEINDYNLSTEFQEYIKYINVSGHNLNVTFDNLLDLSKIESRKIDINESTINIFDLIKKINNIVRFQIDQKNVNFICELDPNLPSSINCDEVKLTQIIINLLTNAIKFTPANNNVYLKVLKNEDKLLIEVEDQGIGISDDIKNKIFTAFEQGDSSITRKYGGSGLGLSIIKNFAELLGGQISFKSKEGEGSKFSVSLPLIIEQDQPITNSSKPIYKFSSDNIILVIEDNNINQVTVSAMLKKHGISAYFADNGELGVQKAMELEQQGKCPNLILMDLHMPVMSGIEATTKLRSFSQFNNTKIVALTADIDNEVKKKCISIGMDDYLNKPINFSMFNSVLDKYLNKVI